MSGNSNGQSRFLHHHFGTPAQQFNSDKLGMWLFLVTEILLFGGLFCAYSVYRANHPEIFVYAHQFLDKKLGALNTIILIFSSFTMALAVRSAQTSNKRALIAFLAVTVLCAFAFLGVKYVEYSTKWKHGLLPGKHYHPTMHEEAAPEGGTAAPANPPGSPTPPAAASAPPSALTTPIASAQANAPATEGASAAPMLLMDKSKIAPAAIGPPGLAAAGSAPPGEIEVVPKNVQTFFSIYFLMTGLHGLHVIVGIIVIFIIMGYSAKGYYNKDYNTPVELTGLYWHLVDLIWIYLFPLLYLIR